MNAYTANPEAEDRLREFRATLATARNHELSGRIKMADAAGARAGNILASAMRLEARDNVIPMVRP